MVAETGRFAPPHWRKERIMQELMIRNIAEKVTFYVRSEGQVRISRSKPGPSVWRKSVPVGVEGTVTA